MTPPGPLLIADHAASGSGFMIGAEMSDIVSCTVAGESSAWILRHSAPPSDRTAEHLSVHHGKRSQHDRPTMSIERVHPGEVLLTSFTRVGPNVEMELLVALAIMLPCKALIAPRPLANERLLLSVRSQMTYAAS